MKFNWLKRYLPRGLYGRAALILLVPIITLQLLVSVVFIQRHFEDVTQQMTRSLALDLGLLLEEINTAETLAEAVRQELPGFEPTASPRANPPRANP